jgi:hypothetical protein
MSGVNPHRRLNGETVALTLEIGKAHDRLDLSLMYDTNGILRELVFVSRGKIGQGLDLLLHDLGIKLSRAIQGRDPDTGLDAAASRLVSAAAAPEGQA